MPFRDDIADAVKERLRNVVDSFAGVVSFEVNHGLNEQENVHRIIKQSATVCAVIGCATALPLTDFLFLTPIHVKMTLHIAKVKGFEISKDRALDILRELISTVGLSLTGVYLASFVKVIPVVNVLVYAPIIYGATFGIGHVVEAYFHGLKTGKIPSADELRAIFKEQSSKGKVEGAGLRKEEIDQAYLDLKRKVEEREAKKEAEARKETERGHTPLGIRIKEKPVRRPSEKTMGEDPAPPLKVEEELPPAAAAKTIGPATPAKGVEISISLPREAGEGRGGGLEKSPEKNESPSEKSKLLDDLERLAKLRDAGALTAEEFELAKKKLLG